MRSMVEGGASLPPSSPRGRGGGGTRRTADGRGGKLCFSGAGEGPASPFLPIHKASPKQSGARPLGSTPGRSMPRPPGADRPQPHPAPPRRFEPRPPHCPALIRRMPVASPRRPPPTPPTPQEIHVPSHCLRRVSGPVRSPLPPRARPGRHGARRPRQTTLTVGGQSAIRPSS